MKAARVESFGNRRTEEILKYSCSRIDALVSSEIGQARFWMRAGQERDEMYAEDKNCTDIRYQAVRKCFLMQKFHKRCNAFGRRRLFV